MDEIQRNEETSPSHGANEGQRYDTNLTIQGQNSSYKNNIAALR